MTNRLALLVALVCAFLVSTGDRAQAQFALNDTPAVFSVGVGYADIRDGDNESADFRLEYRHGEDFLYLKPFAGVSIDSKGGKWAGIGVLMDFVFYDQFIVTGSIGPGAWDNGDSKDLGHALQFRSQIELGYQFEGKSRLSVAFSHLSNASLSSQNPGIEVLSLYYHLPFDTFF